MSSGLQLTWDEVERLRRLIPERQDWHLHNWAAWVQRYKHGQGFRNRSLGFDGAGTTSLEDLESEVDRWAAGLADSVIDIISIEKRNAIAAVYLCGAWMLRRDLLDSVLVAAADDFWHHAKRKGLA